jgi:ubiquinone/menaquinone biosynthesis C-methylase UbiE
MATTTSIQELPPPIALLRLATGFYVSSALYVAAKLRIADLMPDGATAPAELAKTAGVHAGALHRVMRLLVSAGVFTEDAEGKFALTAIGKCLRSSGPESLRSGILLFGGLTQKAWGELLYCVETGEMGFTRAYGKDSFAYMEEHPELAAMFDEAMASFTKQIVAAVVATYDFSDFGVIMDVGGGNGELLAGILKANPALRGVLFDQPHVIERARKKIVDLGLVDRCSLASGDFFKELPGGCDAYVFKHVIHDWSDEQAAAILRSCRRAANPGAKLLIVEGVYPARIDQSEASKSVTGNDVNMLVCTGGRERSESEFRGLFETAGFRFSRIVPTQSRVSVVEGVRD